MRNNLFFTFFVFAHIILFSQNFGIRFGATTATLTGNSDAYEFHLLNSFSPGYQGSFFGNFILSDVIIIKPEISYRSYKIKQKINFGTSIMCDAKQMHNVFSVDLNFDIELSNDWSFIFGMGLDYLIDQKTILYFVESTEMFNQDLKFASLDQRFDPFANIGLCFKLKKTFLVDIEYRHLLDNWGRYNSETSNHIVSAYNGSVKLHMINLSAAVLF